MWPFEDGFTETDELWDAKERESEDHIVARLKSLLNDVFANDGHTFISFTSHSGAIRAILAAIGHRPFRLETGTMIPVLVKAERL